MTDILKLPIGMELEKHNIVENNLTGVNYPL